MHGDDSGDTAQMRRAEDPTKEPPPEEQRWIAELVREHYAPALRYAARLLHDAAEAEDCVQEAFAEAFSHQASLRDLVGAEHCAVAARARQELVFLKRAGADPVMLELLASRAMGAARRRALAHVPDVPGADAVRLGRARKLQLFLTQPFGVASEWTRWASVEVSIADTLAGVVAILDGAVDDLPEGAFAYAGTLEDVRQNALDGVARRYGE